VISAGASGSLQFLGDTGNLCSKTQAETKRFDCVLITSAQAAALVAPNQGDVATFALSIPGKEDSVQVTIISHETRARQDPATGCSQLRIRLHITHH
jgi:hypothetical protein